MRPAPAAFDALAPWVRDWLELEQLANDRVAHPALTHRFAVDEAELPRAHWPEARPLWRMPYVLLHPDEVREYGPVAPFLADHFGLAVPRGRRLVCVHPANARLLAQLQLAGIRLQTSEVWCTPTSSFRSLLAWHPARPERAAVLKLALHVRISGVSRHVGEREVLGSIYTSRLVREIPLSHRQQIGFTAFDDLAGSYCAGLQLGQICRELPADVQPGSRLVPAFSIGSALRGQPVLQQLADEPARAAALVHELLAQHVRTTSFLMLHEGIAHEFHAQNVLFEIHNGQPHRVVLRDFYRSPVRPPLRRLRGRPLPAWPQAAASGLTPLYYLYMRLARRAPSSYLRVYGIRGVVWEWARALRRLGLADTNRALQSLYLRWWQEASAVWLGVWPKRLAEGPSLALNEAIDLFLSRRGRRP